MSGLKLRAAFEHEFQLKSKSGLEGEGFGRAGFERHRALCETIVTHITGAGLKLDSIMKEYGPEQYEVVIAPEEGVKPLMPPLSYAKSCDRWRAKWMKRQHFPQYATLQA